jgi:uncharacterized protein (DUF952 family)
MTSIVNFVYKIYPNTPAYQLPHPLPSSTQLPWLPLDISTNYFHMSTAAQIPGTLALFFDAYDRVQLVKIAYDKLGDVKWELADNGNTYPHLYGVVEGQSVVDVKAVEKRDSWEVTSKQLAQDGWLEQ